MCSCDKVLLAHLVEKCAAAKCEVNEFRWGTGVEDLAPVLADAPALQLVPFLAPSGMLLAA